MYNDIQSSHEHRQMFTAMCEAMNGQQGAWEKLSSLIDTMLVSIRRQYAFRFCVWISGEDILQEVKLKIHRYLVKTRIIQNPEVRHERIVRLARSVKRIARNAVIDQVRGLRGDTSPIRNVRLDEKEAETYEVFFATDANTYEIVLAKELTSDLTEEEREMLFKYVIEEMSLREIAAASGVDKNKVARNLKGALKKLVKRTLET